MKTVNKLFHHSADNYVTMYFVAYLKTLKKNVVLPANWIHEIGDHFEKFMNRSINTSQWFLCYYTTNSDAFVDGCPNKDFEPDFDADILTEINASEPFDGCFLGRLKQFRRKYSCHS